MSRPPSLCVYCQRPGRTKEHFWGKWLLKILPPVYSHTMHTISRFDKRTGTLIQQPGLGSRQGGLRTQQIKAPCRECNMGWMRRTNERARPIIERLVEDGPWLLNDEERRDFSRWAIMLTMTWEFADIGTLVTSQAERNALRTSLVPPDTWAVFIAPYEGTEWVEKMNHRALTLNEPNDVEQNSANTQTNVFTLGKTAVNTVSGLILRYTTIERYSDYFKLQVVWPRGANRLVKTANDLDLTRIATVGTSHDLQVPGSSLIAADILASHS